MFKANRIATLYLASLDLKHHDADVDIDIGETDLVRVCGVEGLKDFFTSHVVRGKGSGGGYAFFSEGKPGQKYINKSGGGILVIRRENVRKGDFSMENKHPSPINEIKAKYLTEEEAKGAIGGGGSKIVAVFPFRDNGSRVEAYGLKDGKYIRMKSISDLV